MTQLLIKVPLLLWKVPDLMHLVSVQPLHWYRTSAPLRTSQLPWDYLCKQREILRTSALPRGYQRGIIVSSIWISFNCTVYLDYECISRWLTLNGWDGFQQFPRQITFGSQREIALYPIKKTQRETIFLLFLLHFCSIFWHLL